LREIARVLVDPPPQTSRVGAKPDPDGTIT
jgi:hypothetical protein